MEDNNADIADLERALAAVKARSTATAEKERAYLSRIKELEEVNRALVFKLANAGLVTGGAAGDDANGGAGGQIPPGLPRPPSSEAMNLLANDNNNNNNNINRGGGGGATAGAAAASPRVSGSSGSGSPNGIENDLRGSFGKSPSFTSVRTKTQHLKVVQLEGAGAGAGAGEGAGVGRGSWSSDGSGDNNNNEVPGAAVDPARRHLFDDNHPCVESGEGGEAEGNGSGGGAGDSQLASNFATKVNLIDTSLAKGKRDQGRRGGFGGNHQNSFSVESLDSLVYNETRAHGGAGAGVSSLHSSGASAAGGGSDRGGGLEGGRVTVGGLGKVPFQMLLCNDDGCEVHEPPDRSIRSRLHGVPHSQFSWGETPKNVLIVKKPNDKGTTAVLPLVVEILRKKSIKAWVEPPVHWETGLGNTWDQDDDPHLDKIIDFIVCLGGDGTILWVSNLFPKAVPPVISFAMGSLGFLTAFEEESIPRAIDDVVRGNFFFTQRSRLVAHVVKIDGREEHQRYVVLNEVVIERGANPHLIDLDVNIDSTPMTKVLADGVMISTPTGSTAYSLAAGGSMVHPGVSGLLFVPICPHTLSFRPLVLPDSVVLTIRVPEEARVEPSVSFDGKQQRLIRRGESLVVKGWRYPVPAICNGGESVDWFRAVKSSLLWNVRGSMQKPLES